MNALFFRPRPIRTSPTLAPIWRRTDASGRLKLAAAALFCLISMTSQQAFAAGAGAADDPWSICPRHIRQAETEKDLPPHLLTAISKVESGRWHAERKASLAWPWTVMAEGKGRYLPSKAAAVAEVRALRARGIRNIDVGCMQINLYYHPEAFETLEQAFDPRRNTAYAAELLSGLRRSAGSWTRAIGDYHSRTISFARVYRLKVFKAWRAERHTENRRRREQRMEAHRLLREQQRQARVQQQARRQRGRQARQQAAASGSTGIWR